MALDEIAESSPAQGEVTATQEPENQDAETQTTADEAVKPSEDSPDSEKSESESSEGEEDESRTSSEDAKQSEKRHGSKAEKRIKQLTAKIKALESRLDRPQQELQAQAEMPQEPVAPKVEDFESWDAYTQANNEYLAKRDEFVAEKARRESAEKAQKEAEEAERKKLISDIEKREVKTLERYPDYNRDEARKIVQPNQGMDNFFVYSEIGPDVLYQLSEDPDEASRIRDLPFWQMAKELIYLEDKLLAQIKGINKVPKIKKSAPSYVDDSGASPAEEVALEDRLWK